MVSTTVKQFVGLVLLSESVLVTIERCWPREERPGVAPEEKEVWVVTGGDFPVAVCDSEASATAHIVALEDEERRNVGHSATRWRYYKFNLRRTR
jgi:hypothetical protein